MQFDLLIVDLFVKGGLIMWPLLFFSTLALAVMLERGWFWWQTKRRREPQRVGQALALLEGGQLQTAAREPEPKVYLNADKKVDYGEVIIVLDSLRQAGITKVAFETEALPDPKAP